ncbi:hypothetical protein [Streptomyces pinistramenti]|uniref:hypothetical protein n=1 Tax=Streptomyces pinistramenti TaxID=2884812 RepID=UPI001D066A71|nr:hypothetical protein [Streptomyces pinistramenti]MCB5909490.1 hypothetical protein [Streptomyces pinistramenti]
MAEEEARGTPATHDEEEPAGIPRPRPAGGTPGPARRALLAATAATGIGLLAGCGGSGGRADPAPGAEPPRGTGRPSPAPPGTAPAPGKSGHPGRKRPELPRGGRELFPRYRLVGFCGLPGAAALGRLGTGDPGERADEIEKQARAYTAGREAMPVLELLTVVATAAPGPDGRYRSRTPDATIRRFHRIAGEHRALLLLNIQPGRARVLDEVKALRPWLLHPDVGVALDPEWEMGPGEVPGDRFGHTSGRELTGVADYLSGLVAAHDLPQKPLVFHQVAASVLHEEAALRRRPGVALIKSADGIGSPDLKRDTWRRLVGGLPAGVHTGFKLFYEEDAEGSRLMTPDEVLALRPRPEYVMYE